MPVGKKNSKQTNPLDPSDVDALMAGLAAKDYMRRQAARKYLVALGRPAVPA